MTTSQDFAAAYRRGVASWPGSRLAPSAMAAAVTEMTDADGVGLSMFDNAGYPMPIGASCANSTLAEQLQFTVGQGPCHDAHRTGAAVVATETVIASSWPAYHDLLVTHTTFRSVVALPLLGPLAPTATIDLLFYNPHAAAHLLLPRIGVLCRHVTAALIEADLIAADQERTTPQPNEDSGPVWLSSPSGMARSQVMVAAGILTHHLGVSPDDAVKVLKARAYATGSTTDDVAAALVHGHTPVTAFDPTC